MGQFQVQKFHSNFFPGDGWKYIAGQISRYGLSVITWHNVVVESVTSITVLSIGVFFPTFFFLPWINPARLYGFPQPTVSAVEFHEPLQRDKNILPIATPQP